MIFITIGSNAVPAFVTSINVKSYVSHFCDFLSRETGYPVSYNFDDSIKGYNVSFRFNNQVGIKIGEVSAILKKIAVSFIKHR